MHKYGMRLRGFSIGCQPMEGLKGAEEDAAGRYHNILTYDRELTAQEVAEYELDPLDGIYTRDTFRYDLARVGDLVNQDVVDDAMNILPPACMTGRCAQMGEPCSTVADGNGKWRYTYHTFTRVGNGIWKYCGKCFRGKTKEAR